MIKEEDDEDDESEKAKKKRPASTKVSPVKVEQKEVVKEEVKAEPEPAKLNVDQPRVGSSSGQSKRSLGGSKIAGEYVKQIQAKVD